MGPYRNTTAIQAEDILKVKLNRHNIHGYISKKINVFHTSQYSISYYHHKPNNTSINNKNNASASAIVAAVVYVRPTYNITRPVTISNYTSIQHQFGFNYDINAAREAGFIDKLEDYYTKCRLVNIFQIKGNYLLLNEIDVIYFSVYYRALVYEERPLVCIEKKRKLKILKNIVYLFIIMIM